MQLKKFTMVLLLSSSLSTVALAKNSEVTPPYFSESDIQQLFVKNQSTLQLAPLSLDEMQSTEGAFGSAGAIMGGAIGGINYVVSAVGGGEWNWWNFGNHVVGGAVVGAITEIRFQLRMTYINKPMCHR